MENNGDIPNKRIKKENKIDIEEICDTMMSRLTPHFKQFGDKINERITNEVQGLRKEIEDIKKNPNAMQPAAASPPVDMSALLGEAGKALGVDLSGLKGLLPQGQAGGISAPNMGGGTGGLVGGMGNLMALAEILKVLGPMLGITQQQNPMMASMFEMMMRNQMASMFRSSMMMDAVMRKITSDPEMLAKFSVFEKSLVQDPLYGASQAMSANNAGQQGTTPKNT